MTMPLYNYDCVACGPFRDWRPMSQSDADAECPSCGAPAKRAVSMPFLACVSRATRIAHERNERSAESPAVVRREHLPGADHGHTHIHRHDHGRAMYRPNMLGHAH